MEKDIGKIKKGEYQGSVTEIVLGIREYNGKVGLDIREFVSGGKYTGPTKKGLRIPAESFKEFKEMINSIDEKDLEVSGAAKEKTEGYKESQKKPAHNNAQKTLPEKDVKEEIEEESEEESEFEDY
ncbi:MAG: transcriptional coactivator p15/PC4 family protein [Nanoarchaeota archaeon]